MNEQYRNKVISIVIPAYNGSEFLSKTLDSIVAQRKFENVEVIVCDDRSSDRTREVALSYCAKHDNVRLFENRDNLGMDRNFEQAAAHATGEYIWFCGQDDIFDEGAIEKVLAVLGRDSSIDFIYVNFSQLTHSMDKIITERMLILNSDVLCTDPQSFFTAVGTLLPGFLPAFVLRRSLWNSVDKTRFYGTQFVQIGVLLNLLKQLRIYIVAHPYVKGRIPDTGWQQNRLKVLDVFTGFLEIVTDFYKQDPGFITERLYKKHVWFCWKNSLYSVYVLRLQGIPLNAKIQARLPRIFGLGYLLPINILLWMPRSIAKLLNPIVTVLVERYKRTHPYRGDD